MVFENYADELNASLLVTVLTLTTTYGAQRNDMCQDMVVWCVKSRESFDESSFLHHHRSTECFL